MLDYLMEQLSKELKIDPPLKPESRGVYAFLFTPDLSITFSELPIEGMMLSSNLGKFPEDREEEIFTHMLRANLFGEATHGATIGLTQTGTNVMLTQAINRRLGYTEFREIVEDFMNVADCWHARLKGNESLLLR